MASQINKNAQRPFTGIDVDEWNPETDFHLPMNYSPRSPEGKAICKAYLQKVAQLLFRFCKFGLGIGFGRGSKQTSRELCDSIGPTERNPTHQT